MSFHQRTEKEIMDNAPIVLLEGAACGDLKVTLRPMAATDQWHVLAQKVFELGSEVDATGGMLGELMTDISLLKARERRAAIILSAKPADETRLATHMEAKTALDEAEAQMNEAR